MAACTGLIVANIYYAQPLIILIANDLGLTEPKAGEVIFYTQLGYAAGLLLCVPLGDILERKRQIVFTTLLAVVALVLGGLATNKEWLFASGFFIGFTSCVPQLILPLAATLAKPEERGRTIGIVMSGLLIGILLSRTLSGFVGAWLGWRSMFFIAASMCLVLAAGMWRLFPFNKPAYKSSYASLMRSLADLWRTLPVLREAAFINACCFAAFGLFWTTIVLLLSREPFLYSSDKIGLLGIAAASGALGAPLIGKIADRKSPRVAIGYGLVLVIISYPLMFVFNTSIIAIIAGVIILDLGLQSVHVSNQTRIYALLPEARNRINTVFMCISFIGTSLGSALGLMVWKQWEWTGVCLLGTILSLIALLIYAGTYKKPA